VLLRKSNPELLREWDSDANIGIDLDKITTGSNKRVSWVCSLGHRFSATVYHRVSGTGCPVCANKSVLVGVNDLASQNPELAASFSMTRNQADPQSVMATSSKKFWWQCEFGHEWVTSVYKRSTGQGCPVCTNRVVLRGFNDMASRYPIAKSTWHPTKNLPKSPEDVPFGSGSTFWWRCSRGHEWKASFRATRVGEGCSVCSGKKILPGHNDFRSMHPERAEMWDASKNKGQSPSKIATNSTTSFWWTCPKGHSFHAPPSILVATRSSGCPYCSGKKVLKGFNDLKATDPELASQWNAELNVDNDVYRVTRGSDKLAAWNCERGHSWWATISSRALQGVGCPTCSGNKLESGFNDLATRYPNLVSEWEFDFNVNLEPSSVMPGSHTKAWWICSHGHRWQASIANRSKGRGCPVCRFSEPGVNDLASSYPELLEEWDTKLNKPLEPNRVSKASGQRVFWRCEKNHSWRTSIANRTVVGTGCPNCAVSGFRAAEPGILYFLRHDELQARKIGVTNSGNSRLSKFELKGWRVLNLLENPVGQQIFDLEQELLSWVRRDLGLPAFLAKDDMRGLGGWTETFSIEGPSDSEVIMEIHRRNEILESQQGQS